MSPSCSILFFLKRVYRAWVQPSSLIFGIRETKCDELRSTLSAKKMAAARPSWISLYGNRLNLNVGPNRSPLALKFVGHQMRNQLRNAGIQTLQDFLNHLFRAGTNVTANRTWLQQVLQNPRRTRCVGKANRAVRNNRYSVLEYNLFAFNALVTYARRRAATRLQRRKVPVCTPLRRPNEAYPDRCRRP
jgi:hypothetical protein